MWYIHNLSCPTEIGRRSEYSVIFIWRGIVENVARHPVRTANFIDIRGWYTKSRRLSILWRDHTFGHADARQSNGYLLHFRSVVTVWLHALWSNAEVLKELGWRRTSDHSRVYQRIEVPRQEIGFHLEKTRRKWNMWQLCWHDHNSCHAARDWQRAHHWQLGISYVYNRKQSFEQPLQFFLQSFVYGLVVVIVGYSFRNYYQTTKTGGIPMLWCVYTPLFPGDSEAPLCVPSSIPKEPRQSWNIDQANEPWNGTWQSHTKDCATNATHSVLETSTNDHFPDIRSAVMQTHLQISQDNVKHFNT